MDRMNGINRIMRKSVVLIVSATAMILLSSPARGARRPRAKYRVKIASIAPDGSAWMRTFTEMSDEIFEATGGQVRFKAYPGGVLGEEKDVLYKIKVGQVDGGAFLGFGIGKICPDARSLMLPMLFEDHEEVDVVMQEIRPYLEKKCLENNFVALGWTEVGFSYLYSTVPVRDLKDLRASKPWTLAGDKMMRELFAFGKVSAIPIPVGDVLTALQTGLIKTVFSPPLAAVAMQWFTRVEHRTDLRLLYSFGGLFVSRKSWERIPADMRKTILEITHEHTRQLTMKVRASNAEALQVMAKNGIKLVEPTDEGRREFGELSDAVANRLEGKNFSTEAARMVRQYLDEHRNAAGNE